MNGALVTKPSFNTSAPRTNYMAGNNRWQLSQTDPRLQHKGSSEKHTTINEIERQADPRLTTYTEMGQKKDQKKKTRKPRKRAKKKHRKK